MGAVVGCAGDAGRKSGQARTVPLARGPLEGHVLWLIAVHGRHAAFAKNLVAHPRVRVKMRGRWYPGTASLAPLDDGILRRFNFYARGGPRVFGIDAALVRIELDPDC